MTFGTYGKRSFVDGRESTLLREEGERKGGSGRAGCGLKGLSEESFLKDTVRQVLHFFLFNFILMKKTGSLIRYF